MAVTSQKTNFSAIIQISQGTKSSIARSRFKLKKKQVQEILINAINEQDFKPYNELVRILKEWPTSDDNFKVLLEDCISGIVFLNRDARIIVETICGLDWVGRSSDLVELFMTFCLDLVTAHSYHSPVLISALLKHFKGGGVVWDKTPPDDLLKSWSNVHTVIAKILAIMPMSSNVLLCKIIEQYPYYKLGSFANRAYVYNLVWITRYIPSLMEQIITTIVSRMIIMDVNICDKEKLKEKECESFVMDVDDTEEVRDTLDYCMLEMINWLQDERDRAFDTMCNIFEKMILPTYSTRHVQFLLLYTISISQQCADRVLHNLWVMAAGLHALGPGAVATRRTAASHLAGLLARCVRLPHTRLTKYLRRMAAWCHAYVTATQESTAADNLKVHAAFHAMCHAVFYLVAFKHQHLFATKEGISFVESLNLPRLVACKLNPLRSCPPAVTRAFSGVARAHQVAYCQPVVERNARYTLAPPDALDCWFPYDPYDLDRSGEAIWPLCVEYKEWPQDGDGDTQYESRVRRRTHDEDDFLSGSPAVKLAVSKCATPGFKYM